MVGFSLTEMDYFASPTKSTDPYFAPPRQDFNLERVPEEYRGWLYSVLQQIHGDWRLWEAHKRNLEKEIHQIENNNQIFLNYSTFNNPNYIENSQKQIDKLIFDTMLSIEQPSGISRIPQEFKRGILHYYNLLVEPDKQQVEELHRRIRELYVEKLNLKSNNDVQLGGLLEEFIVDLAHRYEPLKINTFRKSIIPSLNPQYQNDDRLVAIERNNRIFDIYPEDNDTKYYELTINEWFELYREELKNKEYYRDPNTRARLEEEMRSKPSQQVERELVNYDRQLQNLLMEKTDKIISLDKFIRRLTGASGNNLKRFTYNPDIVFYGGRPINVLYDEYKNRFLTQSKEQKERIKREGYAYQEKDYGDDLEKYIMNSGFRNPKKIKPLVKKMGHNWDTVESELSKRPKLPTNYFPKKANRKYQLKHVSQPGTYQMDLMFSDKFTYMIMINVNTRMVYFTPTNKIVFGDENKVVTSGAKRTEGLLEAFDKLRQMTPIRKIIMDSEPGMKSGKAQAFLKQADIKIKMVVAKDNHSSLALIDRLIRTIRDMNYVRNGGQNRVITPEALREMVYIYNNSVHSGLSKIMGFSITPQEMTPNYEAYFIRKASQHNVVTKLSGDYDLLGQEVVMINETDKMEKKRSQVRPVTYKVTNSSCKKLTLEDPEGKQVRVPRYKVNPIHSLKIRL